jgi:hypothetical protein
MRDLAKTDLLVLDDLGLAPLEEGERHDLLEILEERSTLDPSDQPISRRALRYRRGMISSATRPWPMPSWIGSSTTLTGFT